MFLSHDFLSVHGPAVAKVHLFSSFPFIQTGKLDILIMCIVYKHWPVTHEFFTRTVELWNRWIRVSCYYYRV